MPGGRAARVRLQAPVVYPEIVDQPWQIAVNMLLLGTGAWLLWLVVPGSRRR